MIRFTFGKYRYEISFNARRGFFDLKVYRDSELDTYHLVWGRFSFYRENFKDNLYPICSQCESPECREVGCGDEMWTICPECESVEQGYRYINLIEYESF